MTGHDWGDYDFEGNERVVDTIKEVRAGLLRATLLFGAVAAGLALVAAPAAISLGDRYAANPPLDMMATGSIEKPSGLYTVRRSVLQSPGATPCLLFPGRNPSDAGC